MRKMVLNIGEKIFGIFMILFLIAGTASAVMAGRAIYGAKPEMLTAGLMTGISQTLMSWTATLIIALIVYSLLDIRRSVSKDNNG